eukprot:scaffold398112_cov40-Prasinocladus_malaysianus.AAC.1
MAYVLPCPPQASPSFCVLRKGGRWEFLKLIRKLQCEVPRGSSLASNSVPGKLFSGCLFIANKCFLYYPLFTGSG